MKKIVFLFLWITSSTLGGHKIFAQDTDSTIIAEIGEEVIYRFDFDRTFQTIQSYPIHEDKEKEELICVALKKLLMDKLIICVTNTDTFTIQPKLVNDKVEEKIEYILSHMAFDEELFYQIHGKTVEEMRLELYLLFEEQMLVMKMKDSIVESIIVTQEEVEAFFETDSIYLLKIPYQVEVAHLVVEAIVTKKEKRKVLKHIKKIRKAIEKGEITFEEAADSLSQDRGSAIRGGGLDWHYRGELIEEYENEIFSMDIGEFRITESQFGFHLIQLLDRKGEEYDSRHILLEVQNVDLKGRTLRKLEDIKEKIIQGELNFAQAAQIYSDDEKSRKNGGQILNPLTGKAKIDYDKLESPIFFNIDDGSIKVGEISEPMPYRTDLGKDAYRIIYFISDSPEHLADIEQDYHYIQYLCLEDKKKKAPEKWFVENLEKYPLYIHPDYRDCSLLMNLDK